MWWRVFSTSSNTNTHWLIWSIGHSQLSQPLSQSASLFSWLCWMSRLKSLNSDQTTIIIRETGNQRECSCNSIFLREEVKENIIIILPRSTYDITVHRNYHHQSASSRLWKKSKCEKAPFNNKIIMF